jgi:hypothetical protein
MSEQTTPAPKKTFDALICEKLKQLITEHIFTVHPEVRGLAVSIDWASALNDADIKHGIWIGSPPSDEIVSKPDAIHGSIRQTLRMLDLQCSRAVRLNEHLRGQLQNLATEVVRKNEELKKIEEEIQRRRSERENLA